MWPGSRFGSGYPAFLFQQTGLNELAMKTETANPFEKELEIVNELGLHARAAAKIAKLAARAEGSVTLRAGEQTGDAKSILDILALGCHKGTKIVIGIESARDCNILTAIARQVESGFGEPE